MAFSRNAPSRYAHLVDLMRALSGDDLPIEHDGSRIGRDPADADIEQCRFAGAVWPDDRVRRALLDLQIDVG
jgi:hypothetical protein